MINAIIESKGNTLVTELPIGIYTLYDKAVVCRYFCKPENDPIDG